MRRQAVRRRVAVLVAGALVVPWLGGHLAWGDVVTLTPDATTKGASGGLVRGTVTSESPEKVEVKLGNTVTAIPTNEVAAIEYDGHPASLEQARDKEGLGALAEAIELYKKAAADAATKPFIAEDAAFGQARATAELAQSEPGKVAEAVSLLDAFTRAHKNGRHIGPALEALARLQIALEKYTDADATLASIAKLPGGDDRAASLRIKLLTRRGKTGEAISEIDKIIAANPDGSARKRDATLAKAEALAALKKYPEAETLVRSVIKAAPSEDAATQALAHNTLGDCLRAAGKPKEALYAYLHTDLLFSKEKDEHARALGQIAQLWREMKRLDRADEVLERLKQEYPRSPAALAASQ